MALTFTCKTITPMAMSGADKDKIELRPPSFKGILRFWWRALHGNLSLEELRKKEGEIFGASDENIGKSKIIIKIKSQVIEDKDKWKEILTGDEKKRFPNKAIKPEFPFNIIFNNSDNSGLDLSKFFPLVTILGGFGKRSRRGFGSIEIKKINDLPFFLPTNSDHVLDKILKLINSINPDKYIKDITSSKIVKKRSKSNPLNEYPFIEEIEIGREDTDYLELLRKIGKASHDHDCDYTGFAKGKDRFASPVYVSVIKVNNKFRPIITTLACCPEKPLNGNNKSKDFKEAILK